MGGAFGGTGEEGGVSLVRGVVVLNEIAEVDFIRPVAGFETVPSVLLGFGEHRGGRRHVVIPQAENCGEWRLVTQKMLPKRVLFRRDSVYRLSEIRESRLLLE